MEEENELALFKAAKEIEYWQDELNKCMKDSYYFYSNYCLINGEKPTMGRSEYEARLNYLKHFTPIKSRNKL